MEPAAAALTLEGVRSPELLKSPEGPTVTPNDVAVQGHPESP